MSSFEDGDLPPPPARSSFPSSSSSSRARRCLSASLWRSKIEAWIQAENAFNPMEKSVEVPSTTSGASFWRKLGSFLGPALFVSVGYLDPGNWATDIAGGSQFGYSLLWVLFLSNIMALTLQILTTRLALVTQKDLALICRGEYPRPVRIMLWVLMEIAIAATDLAEVLGTAIGLQLLFRLPLIAGVVLTVLDTLIFLLVQKYGIRKLEVFILLLLGIIGMCFIVELFMIAPPGADVMSGFVPQLSSESISAAVGILGATVMPHNFYLHSGLVQSRKFAYNIRNLRQAFKFNVIDTVISLNFAFFVNASILIVAAAVFYTRGIVVEELQDAYTLLGSLMGTRVASIMFGLGLFCAGQSSTLTGTMAGQIVMEGFLDLQIAPWLRRLGTRIVAIVPAVIVILATGESGTYKLLIFSQVVLSLALPFAVIPVVRFTASASIMGPFVNHIAVTIIASIMVLFILSLNVWAIVGYYGDLLAMGLTGQLIVGLVMAPVCLFLIGLVIYITFFWKVQSRFYLVEENSTTAADAEEASTSSSPLSPEELASRRQQRYENEQDDNLLIPISTTPSSPSYSCVPSSPQTPSTSKTYSAT
eukprot:TRINITY_DN1653_c0_g2_i2.p1 TRINITY_DN1653_c0_g2~~TRINITY_DN1653_c0_g2_i2.p1  ORF type:complete len:590 (-),score=112.88 TRINITY_DN1653_c0_g2_i2:17-1786(-)